jgi:hypothetical protein
MSSTIWGLRSRAASTGGKYRREAMLVASEVSRSDRLLGCEHARGQAQYHQRFSAEHGLGLFIDR